MCEAPGEYYSSMVTLQSTLRGADTRTSMVV